MYIDYKKTTWERIHISESDKTNEEIIEFVKANQQNNTTLWDFLDDEPVIEQLCESDEFMTTEGNGGQKTIEVYDDDDSLIWDNVDEKNRDK